MFSPSEVKCAQDAQFFFRENGLKRSTLTLIVCVEIQNGDYAGDPMKILAIHGV